MQKSYGNSPTEDTFAFAPALIVFVCLECLVAVQTLLAFHDHFLTISQMRQVGVDQGLPFVWHFAMWGDLLIVSTLAAYLIGRHSFSWEGQKMLISFALGFALAAILSWTYTFSGIPNAHVHNHRITVVGLVHLFYMAIALGLFIQFLFFTKDISVRLLRVTSLLLFLHVFVGTHMALGILNVISPLDWYPDQPLKSIVGWSTVATVTLGLVCCNVGISNIARWIKNIVMWLFLNRVKTSEDYFKFIYSLSTFVTFVFFIKIFISRWQQEGISLPTILILLIGIVFGLSMHSAKRELGIVKLVFLEGHIPNEFAKKNRVMITCEVVVFMGSYIGLGFIIQYIMFASLLMVIIAVVDFRTRYKINKDVKRYFADSLYDLPQGKEYDVKRESREVVKKFLFVRRHLLKEGLRCAGFAIALIIAIYGFINNTVRLNNYAYVICIGTLILNEVVTIRWRVDRDNNLEGAWGRFGLSSYQT